MSSYDRQKAAIERAKKKHPTMAPVLLDAADTIARAELLEKAIDAIYECASKEREACIHCDSVAKLIEELRA